MLLSEVYKFKKSEASKPPILFCNIYIQDHLSHIEQTIVTTTNNKATKTFTKP